MANRPEHEWEVSDDYEPTPVIPRHPVSLTSLREELSNVQYLNRPDHLGRTYGLEATERFLITLISMLEQNDCLILERT